jgi:pyruvate/2-oxoglutarate dehydrogenase complex dihydrolipoamide acyltransferase (E2) component
MVEAMEDQPLGAFETDKAVVDITCPRSGKIKVLFRWVAEVVKVDFPVAKFEVLDRRRLQSSAIRACSSLSYKPTRFSSP